MTNFKTGDRVRITAPNLNEGVFNGTLGTYVGRGGIFHHVKPDIWPDTDYECFGTRELTKIEEENNMTKINLSTGVEATLHGNGDVTLPGDYMTNTSFLEASGVTWEPEYAPGVYRDEDGDLWVLTPGGDWLHEIGTQGLQNSEDSAPPYEYYTLTPVKPGSF